MNCKSIQSHNRAYIISRYAWPAALIGQTVCSRDPLDTPHFGTVENPVAMMKHEHDVEGERFRTIASLSNDYTPPEDACNTYRVTFALLKEFEEDLHMHIHLENNILFPKAIAREKYLRETNKV